MTPVRLALVPGEPAGVGPELCVRLAQRPRDHTLTVFADARTLRAAAEALCLPLRLLGPDEATTAPGELALVDIPNAAVPDFGQPDPRNAAAVIGALRQAAQGCLDGRFDGVVTGPVHKAVINEGGIAYTGTTELLADQAGCDVVMMLANDVVRVALVTTHLPLREVADAITANALEHTLRTTHDALVRDFGIADPVIAVLGLNPHAGEAAIWATRKSTSSNRRWRRCARRACTWPGRCPPIPPSCPPSCVASTRWSRCTTTRACRCSNTVVSSAR